MKKSSFTYSLIKVFILFAAFSCFFFVLAILKGSGYSKSFDIQSLKQFSNSPNVKLENNVTVVYFWATWCGVCETQKPLIHSYYEKSINSNSFDFISIEEGENMDFLQKYVSSKQVKFPILIADMNFLQKWNIEGFPTFIFLDKNQKVRFVDSGILTPVSFYLRILYLNLF